MFKIDRTKLRESHEGLWLLIDFVMLSLLLINLIFIVFDSLYETSFFREALNWLSPNIVPFYQPAHDNFILIDLAFISVFLTEFCIRWFVAVKQKTYLRWYFFPFLHWYDLVGCIPLSGTRVFRFLRIFSILYRLHKFQIIDFRQLGLIRFVSFYYDVFIEELSDRIVVKVLSDAQNEIVLGSPLAEAIVAQVLKPRHAILNKWLANTISHIGASIDDIEQGHAIREHVKQSVSLAVRENKQVSTLNLVPVVGSTIEKVLESAVSDIVIQSIVHLLKGMTPEKVNDLIQQTIQTVPAEDENVHKEVLAMITECIELLKVHVSQQRWKSQLSDS